MDLLDLATAAEHLPTGEEEEKANNHKKPAVAAAAAAAAVDPRVEFSLVCASHRHLDDSSWRSGGVDPGSLETWLQFGSCGLGRDAALADGRQDRSGWLSQLIMPAEVALHNGKMAEIGLAPATPRVEYVQRIRQANVGCTFHIPSDLLSASGAASRHHRMLKPFTSDIPVSELIAPFVDRPEFASFHRIALIGATAMVAEGSPFVDPELEWGCSISDDSRTLMSSSRAPAVVVNGKAWPRGVSQVFGARNPRGSDTCQMLRSPGGAADTYSCAEICRALMLGPLGCIGDVSSSASPGGGKNVRRHLDASAAVAMDGLAQIRIRIGRVSADGPLHGLRIDFTNPYTFALATSAFGDHARESSKPRQGVFGDLPAFVQEELVGPSSAANAPRDVFWVMTRTRHVELYTELCKTFLDDPESGFISSDVLRINLHPFVCGGRGGEAAARVRQANGSGFAEDHHVDEAHGALEAAFDGMGSALGETDVVVLQLRLLYLVI